MRGVGDVGVDALLGSPQMISAHSRFEAPAPLAGVGSLPAGSFPSGVSVSLLGFGGRTEESEATQSVIWLAVVGNLVIKC